MSELLKLPVEILLQMTNDLTHQDLESATLSCTHLYNVAIDRLIWHRTRKREFSHLVCGDLPETCGLSTHPADLLEKILRDESITAYPIQLTVGQCSHRQDDVQLSTRYPLERDTRTSSSKDTLRIRAEQVVPLLYRFLEPTNEIFELWDCFIERIMAGHSGHVFALLLTLLPNLESLSVKRAHSINCPWLEMVSVIASRSWAKPDSVLPLHHLHTVSITNHCFDPLYVLTRLPSLRSAYVQNLWICSEYLAIRPSPWLISNIVTLSFEKCHVHSRALDTLLRGTRSLREFTCHHSGPRRHRWRPRLILEVLLRHAGHSLVSLSLKAAKRSSWYYVTSDGWDTYLKSLRGFKVLASICLDLPMLMDGARKVSGDTEAMFLGLDDSEDNPLSPTWYLEASKQTQIVHRLINYLPASAETLTLEMPANQVIMQAMLRRLPERKEVRLPNLTEIHFECEERCVTGMEEACDRVGVKLVQILKYGNSKHKRSNSGESGSPSSEHHINSDCSEDYYHRRENDCQVIHDWEERLLDEAEDFVTDEEYLVMMYEDAEAIEYLVSQAGDLASPR